MGTRASAPLKTTSALRDMWSNPRNRCHYLPWDVLHYVVLPYLGDDDHLILNIWALNITNIKHVDNTATVRRQHFRVDNNDRFPCHLTNTLTKTTIPTYPGIKSLYAIDRHTVVAIGRNALYIINTNNGNRVTLSVDAVDVVVINNKCMLILVGTVPDEDVGSQEIQQYDMTSQQCTLLFKLPEDKPIRNILRRRDGSIIGRCGQTFHCYDSTGTLLSTHTLQNRGVITSWLLDATDQLALVYDCNVEYKLYVYSSSWELVLMAHKVKWHLEWVDGELITY